MGKIIQGKLNYSKYIQLLITPILETWFNERLFFKTVIFIVKCQKNFERQIVKRN